MYEYVDEFITLITSDTEPSSCLKAAAITSDGNLVSAESNVYSVFLAVVFYLAILSKSAPSAVA